MAWITFIPQLNLNFTYENTAHLITEWVHLQWVRGVTWRWVLGEYKCTICNETTRHIYEEKTREQSPLYESVSHQWDRKDGKLYWNWEKRSRKSLTWEHNHSQHPCQKDEKHRVVHVSAVWSLWACWCSLSRLCSAVHSAFLFFLNSTDLLIYLLFDLKSCSGLQCKHWQISSAECDLPSSSTTAHSGTSNSSQSRGGYFLLTRYWLQCLSVSHKQS